MIDALKRLGLNESYEDKDGCYWDSPAGFLWGGILGFCCCGDPNSELKKIKKELELIDAKTPHEGPSIYLYLLDKEGLTSHGFSIYNSIITQKGKDFLTVLQSIEL